jgi:TonB-linked SusC/RagA family outer membrane protein
MEKRKPFQTGEKFLLLRKILRIMKLTTFLFFAATLMVSASVYSQSTRLTLQFSEISYEKLFREIEKQTEFRFAFSNSKLDSDQKIKLDVTNETLEKILDKTLPEGIAYEIIDRYVVILNASELSTTDWQQQPSVSGTVTDEAGEPLPGVTVVVKGTTQGTVTNADGNYLLFNISEDAVLVFSFVGMLTQEVEVGNQTTINIVLKEDIQGIEEVVVVGYGTQKKINLTGSVDVVTSKDLENRPVTNVAQAIQGVSPNLNISANNTGGEPGATQSWNIRGLGTLTGGGGSPYILVDGVPMNINNVNPQDIESVSVLKDAAASAIYGARAPYGVVLITTKRGQTSPKPRIQYSNNVAFSQPTRLPHAANSMDAAMALNYASENSGAAPIFSDETLQRIQDYLDGKITTETIEDPANPNRWGHWMIGNANNDWMSIYFKDWSARQKHDISLSGGTDKLNYFISGGFLDQEGQLNWANEEYERYNMTANFDAVVTEWFKFGMNSKYARTKTVYPNAWAGYDRTVIWHNFTRNWPTNPLYYPNGEISTASSVSLLNQTGDLINKNDDVWVSFYGDIEPVKGWITTIRYNWNNNGYKQTSHKATSYNTYPDGTVYVDYNPVNEFAAQFTSNDYHLMNVISSYELGLDKHYFKLLVGYEEELNESARLWGMRKQLVTDKVPSISTATGDSQVDDAWSHWATQGVFGRFVYNFDEKYLVEFNARYDGSSRFENADTKWGFFPSGSLGYNISKENFWEPLESYVNDFKIRGSWGSLGNQDVANYSYIPILPVRTNLGWIMGSERPVYTLAPGLISNALTWETATTINVGFDAALLDNKLGVTFDWFKRNTTDMVGPAESLPSVLGTGVPSTNNAELETKGFELVLTWRDRIGSDFSYNVKAVLGDNKSTVVKYPNPTNILSNWYEGEVVGDIWGYETAGYFAEGETGADWYDQSALYARWQEGDVKFQDINGDEKINWGDNTVDNPGDMKIIGNNRPRYNFGITAGFNYKGFDFNMFWQGIGKRDFSFGTSTNVFYGFVGNMWQSSFYREHMDYWTPENTDAYYPRPYMTGEHTKNTRTQTKYLQNAAYARLKNVQLGYTLPSDLTQKISVERVRLYVTGENLVTITGMTKLFDPEALGGGWGSGKIYPLSRLLSMGVNVTF